MDPLTASATILAVLNIIEKSSMLIGRFNKALKDDNNFSIIYFKLMAERATYEVWANNMRVVGNQIPPKDLEIVNEIKDKLEETFHRVEKKIGKYEPTFGGKAQRADAKARMKWILGESDEIKELLELIQTLNKGLTIMAPILPPYASPGPSATTEVVSEPHPGSAGHITELSTPLFSNMLWKLFDTCLHCLSIVGLAKDRIGDLANGQAYRLRLWGVGLFQDVISLDELLYASRKHTESLKTFLLEAFVDIAMTEEQILSRWASDASHLNQRAFNNARMRLTSILGAEEVAHLTMEKWQVMLEEEVEVGRYSDEQDIDLVQRLIEVLYDMLPAIRSVRREYILEIETPETTSNLESGTKMASATGSSNTNTEALVEKNLEQVEMIEQAARAQEAASNVQDRTVQIFSKRIAKTRLRLEEWRLNLVDSEDTASKVWNSKEVGKVQSELSRALERFVAPEKANYLTEGTAQSARGSGKAPLKSESLDLNPTDLESLASQFDMAVSHLITAA